MPRKRTVPVQMLGKEYRIKADADDSAIRQAAELVQETMGRVQGRAGTSDSLDVAVLAALNLAHRLLLERDRHDQDDEQLAILFEPLIEKIEGLLAEDAAPAP